MLDVVFAIPDEVDSPWHRRHLGATDGLGYDVGEVRKTPPWWHHCAGKIDRIPALGFMDADAGHVAQCRCRVGEGMRR